MAVFQRPAQDVGELVHRQLRRPGAVHGLPVRHPRQLPRERIGQAGQGQAASPRSRITSPTRRCRGPMTSPRHSSGSSRQSRSTGSSAPAGRSSRGCPALTAAPARTTRTMPSSPRPAAPHLPGPSPSGPRRTGSSPASPPRRYASTHRHTVTGPAPNAAATCCCVAAFSSPAVPRPAAGPPHLRPPSRMSSSRAPAPRRRRPAAPPALLINLIQSHSPDPSASGLGPDGADHASTRPGYVTTGDAATHSPELAAALR